jgi:hypothetical protein
MEDFARWPSRVVLRWVHGVGPDRVAKLKSAIQHGCLVGSDYSGLGGEIEVMHQLGQGLQDVMNFKADDFKVAHTSFCDIGLVQQDVLKWAAAQLCGGACVFGDMNHKLPPFAVNWLDAAMPRKCSLDQAVASYKQMGDYLMSEREQVFNDDVVAYCLAHGKPCKVHLPSRYPDERRVKRMRHNRTGQEDEEKDDETLRMKFGGTICRGWSSSGGQMRFGDPSERLHGVFVAERRHRAEVADEDLFISECVKNYPSRIKLTEPLADTHDVFTVNVNPIEYGYPIRRPRVFSAGINKQTLVWTQAKKSYGNVATDRIRSVWAWGPKPGSPCPMPFSATWRNCAGPAPSPKLKLRFGAHRGTHNYIRRCAKLLWPFI